ncbi:hypothetical protein DASB73_026850 [Starmerella bacillaris]|uniref:Uncharacterized protein n=1 Tax=Starmerella bacillaris TaxID=1247836 RepID=A0AAV5RKH6_STABA|nr:hypothetical protein DASB73_026850 [Starmerella bacillaris]
MLRIGSKVNTMQVIRSWRSFKRSIHTANTVEMPVIKDRFKEMLDDRTSSLFRSLNMDETGHSKPTSETSTMKSHPIYFSTQELYSGLVKGGLTSKQATVLLEVLETFNNEIASQSLSQSVPISADANGRYLIDAASSEIRDEVVLSRQASITTFRSQLARLQRDVEILEQEAMEKATMLKADLDMEIHERKISTRDDENAIDMQIHDLNNKISTRLNSDLKSEIENLRWQITRRSLTCVALISAGVMYIAHATN